LDESAHAGTRSELRGASCEDWKSAFSHGDTFSILCAKRQKIKDV
jgi:hypothetical protein